MLWVNLNSIHCILSSSCCVCLKCRFGQSVWSISHYCDRDTSRANIKFGQYAEVRISDVNFKPIWRFRSWRILYIVNCNLKGLERINSHQRWFDPYHCSDTISNKCEMIHTGHLWDNVVIVWSALVEWLIGWKHDLWRELKDYWIWIIDWDCWCNQKGIGGDCRVNCWSWIDDDWFYIGNSCHLNSYSCLYLVHYTSI